MHQYIYGSIESIEWGLRLKEYGYIIYSGILEFK